MMATGPVYMNATPHHSKVRVSLALSSSLFIAGQDVTGKMEMECRADNGVGLSLIMVELFAIQELNSRDHSASSTFLHTRRLFQGPGLPPSNAVDPHPKLGEPPFPQSYFPARRGITSFFFRFPLPLSSPSSISFASGLAKLRYEVRASVGVAHKGENRVVTDIAETDVVQCEDMDGIAAEHVVVGESGKMYVKGRIVGGRIISGQQACFELRVKNHSSKKTTGLSLTLTRILHLHNAATTSQVPLQLSDILFSQTFRGPEYSVLAGTEGVANLVFDVPKAARAVKGGIREGADDDEGGPRRTDPLFEVQCILGIKIGMGIGHKDVMFEMPVQLSHPATLPDPTPSLEPYAPPAADPYAVAPDTFYGDRSPRVMSPVFHPPHPYFTRSPAPESGTSSPSYPYVSPPIPSSSTSPPQQRYHPSLPIPPYAHSVSPRQHLWSPPPLAVSPLPYYHPDPQQAYYFPPPPVALVPFAYPARPNSAGAGHLRNSSPALSGLPSGLPGVEAVRPVYPAFHHHHQQTDNSFDSHSYSHPEVDLPVNDPVLMGKSISGLEYEGKGERASRISHHLRMSTRARSMSPTSHRFPTTSSALPPTAIALSMTSPQHGPPVLSPRPLISPRNSFSADAVVDNTAQETHGTARSGRVDLLERMVDLVPGEEGKSVEDVLKDLERVKEMELDKTLPKSPVPSVTAEILKKVSAVRRASVVFGLQEERFKKVEVGDKPKKSVLRPSPMARRLSTNGKDRDEISKGRDVECVSVAALRPNPEQHSTGLDALEKRLLLEVGTRKPGAPDRPTVFELGLAVAAPAVPRSISASTHPEAGESEISSLALASNGSTDFYLRKAGQETVSTSTPILGPEVSQVDSEEKVKTARLVRTVATDKDRSPATREERLREEKSKEQEAVKLKKAAKGRVADWLGGVAIQPGPDDIDHGPDLRPLRTSRREDTSPVQGLLSDKTSTNVLVHSLSQTPYLKPIDSPPNAKKLRELSVPILMTGSFSSSPERKSPPKPHKSNDLQGTSLSKPAVATPISSGASPALSPQTPSPVLPPFRKPVPPSEEPILEGNKIISTSAEKAARRLAKLPLPQGVPETKYDVRSARGGRGGIATSVATLWTSLAQEGDQGSQPKPPTKPVTKLPVKHPAFLDVGKSKPSPTSTGAPQKPTTNNVPTPLASIIQPPQPRNSAKSQSVPAAVVPSHARPYLSSTASLARPPSAPLSRAKPPSSLSSTLSESLSQESYNKVTPVSPPDMAFGQARLKDLIKKYQQSAS